MKPLTNLHFQGIIPPVPTIFDHTGEFDPVGMGRLIDNLIHSGVHGLLFLDTSGEFSQMSAEQRKKVAAFSVEYVNGRVPAIIGTGSASTREAIELTGHSKEIGAAGAIVINPYYFPLKEEHLYRHYAAIAEAVDIPILLYNFPGLTGQDLATEFVLKLARSYPNVVGIKESVDSVRHIREIILTVKAERPEFSVFTGYDDHLLNTLALGGDGAISGSSVFAPELALGIYSAIQSGEFPKAIGLHKKLAFLLRVFELDSPFVSALKEAVSMCGLDISTHVLPPAERLTEEQIEKLRDLLGKAGIL